MITEFETKKIKVADIKLDGDNPNSMDNQMQKRLNGSFEAFGNTQDIVIDSKTMILADGEHRLKEYINKGITEIPAKLVPFESDAHRRAYRQAANKIHGEHDPLKDAEEFARMMNEVDNELINTITGMKYTEVEEHIRQLKGIEDDEQFDEETALEAIKDPVTKKGDVIMLGNHRLMCGDSNKTEDVAILTQEDKADMVFTDPPWNVDYGGNLANGKHKDRKIINDSMSRESFLKFLNGAYKGLNSASKGGAMTYIVMSAQEWGRNMIALEENGYHWSSTLIWVKSSLTLSRKDYHPQYEPIWYGWKGDNRLNPLKDRKQSDVWEVDKPSNSEMHPTMKPIELCGRAIINSSKENDIILDTFGGSGSTLIACEQTNRKCIMMEIDPTYCDVIINRWEALTEKEAKRL